MGYIQRRSQRAPLSLSDVVGLVDGLAFGGVRIFVKSVNFAPWICNCLNTRFSAMP